MSVNEFSPTRYFSRVMHYWWVVLLATFVGGAFGYLFFQLHAPVYEASSTFFVTLDLNRFPTLGTREDLIQYNEDMALNTTEGALISTDVLNQVVAQAQGQGKSLTTAGLLDNYTIERKHDIWELRYRSQDPQFAQAIVNIWAQVGYQAMLTWQSSGLAPESVIFQPPRLALLPERPVLYGRSNLILAGALIGFIIGILISSQLIRRANPSIERSNNPSP
jgi:capsular polysaccharide biosynthesis protein